MENSFEKPRGLISRISTLLNNEVCSDVVFHVRHNEEKRAFYAHSAILIAAGNGFHDLAKQTSQAKVIKVMDFSPNIVEMMLRYLYTDELNILSMENAVDLYKLACMYHIDDLEKLCRNYITKEEVNIDNLFVKYESALSCKFPKLLEKCRNLVQLETKAVFASRYFGEAPFCVVEDIFSLDHMNVSNELDVVKAAVRWSEFECRRKGKSTEKEHVKAAIGPLLKHLRFLSLSADEFCDFTANPGNFLDSHECTVLTMKILCDHKGNFPAHLCPISKARQPYPGTINCTVTMVKGSDFYSEPLNKNTFQDPSSVLDSSILDPYSELGTFKDTYSAPKNKNAFLYPHSDAFNKSTLKKPYSEFDNENCFKAPQSEPFSRSFSEPVNRNNLNEPFSELCRGVVNSLKSGQEDFLFYRQSQGKTAPALTKIEQKPIFQYNQKKSTPMLKVLPQQTIPPAGRHIFEFPLQELQRSIQFTAIKDIKCNAKIHMRTGAICIHGIELKIAEKKPNSDESIKVFSCVSNNFPSEHETFDLKLKNSAISVMYPKPVTVTPNNPVDIEITIEDLVLSRCFVCPGQNYELNCGLNVSAEISVISNQSNEQGIALYLISHIIYSMAS